MAEPAAVMAPRGRVSGVVGRLGLGPILLLALIVRFVVLIVHHYVMVLPQGGADAVVFERRAWTLSSGARGTIAEYAMGGGGLLAYLGSLVYDVVGRQPLVLGFVIVLMGVALVYVVYRIVWELSGDLYAARLAALVIALFPQLVLHSVLFLREMPVALLLALAALGAVRLLNRQSLPGLLLFVSASVGATFFHTGAIIAVPGLLVGLLLATPRRGRRRITRYLTNAVAVVALIGTIVFMEETGWGLGKFGGSFESAVSVFETQELRGTAGGAAYPEWMRIRAGLADEGWKVPIRYVAFLFSPLIPLLARSMAHGLGLLDAALYLGIFAVLLRHGRTLVSERKVLAIFVMALALVFGYALGVSNFGTAIRHRAKIVAIFIALSLAVPALARARTRQAAASRHVVDAAAKGRVVTWGNPPAVGAGARAVRG